MRPTNHPTTKPSGVPAVGASAFDGKAEGWRFTMSFERLWGAGKHRQRYTYGGMFEQHGYRKEGAWAARGGPGWEPSYRWRWLILEDEEISRTDGIPPPLQEMTMADRPPTTWIYADPEDPPVDGWYWTRWARHQEEIPRLIVDGKLHAVRLYAVLPWRRFVKEYARQYWPEPIASPPDLWIEQDPPAVHAEWDNADG